MSARDDLNRALRDAYGDGIVFDGLTVNDLIAAALSEEWLNAADAIGPHCEAYGVLGVGDRLRRMAKERATAAAAATPQPANAADRAADWLPRLRTAARDWPGEWTTKRVQHLYLARYGLGRFRGDARLDLEQLHREGFLVLNDQEPGRRFYTFNTRKDATS